MEYNNGQTVDCTEVNGWPVNNMEKGFIWINKPKQQKESDRMEKE